MRSVFAACSVTLPWRGRVVCGAPATQAGWGDRSTQQVTPPRSLRSRPSPSRGGWTALVAAALLTFTVTVHAETPEEFYKGKTVSILVGSPPGGGYDAYARLIAPHLAR